jgi:hypothetical protein
MYCASNEIWAITVVMVEIALGETMKSRMRARYPKQKHISSEKLLAQCITTKYYIAWDELKLIYPLSFIHILQRATQERTPHIRSASELYTILKNEKPNSFVTTNSIKRITRKQKKKIKKIQYYDRKLVDNRQNKIIYAKTKPKKKTKTIKYNC